MYECMRLYDCSVSPVARYVYPHMSDPVALSLYPSPSINPLTEAVDQLLEREAVPRKGGRIIGI